MTPHRTTYARVIGTEVMAIAFGTVAFVPSGSSRCASRPSRLQSTIAGEL